MLTQVALPAHHCHDTDQCCDSGVAVAELALPKHVAATLPLNGEVWDWLPYSHWLPLLHVTRFAATFYCQNWRHLLSLLGELPKQIWPLAGTTVQQIVSTTTTNNNTSISLANK